MSELADDLVAATMQGNLFTDAEARALIKSVVSPTPEELPAMIERVVTWAREVRTRAAIVDVMVSGVPMEVTMGEAESEPAMRLHPDLAVEALDEEIGLERVRDKAKTDEGSNP